MELLIPLALALVGVVTLAVSIRLMVRGPQTKKPKLTRVEQIALETARLEKENKRLEREYEEIDNPPKVREIRGMTSTGELVTGPSKNLDKLGTDLVQRVQDKGDRWETEIRTIRHNLEQALLRTQIENAQSQEELMHLIANYEKQISSSFGASLIMPPGTEIQFRRN